MLPPGLHPTFLGESGIFNGQVSPSELSKIFSTSNFLFYMHLLVH